MKRQDIIEETYTALRNAGYDVALDGMSFVVSLTNRVYQPVRVSKQEIDFVLNNAYIGAILERVGNSVRVRI